MYVVIHACTITQLYFELKQLLNAQSEAGPLREGCEVILGPGQWEGQEVEPGIYNKAWVPNKYDIVIV